MRQWAAFIGMSRAPPPTLISFNRSVLERSGFSGLPSEDFPSSRVRIPTRCTRMMFLSWLFSLGFYVYGSISVFIYIKEQHSSSNCQSSNIERKGTRLLLNTQKNLVALLTPWLTSWLCNGFTGWLLDPNVQPVGRAELFSCDCKLWSPEEQTDTRWIHRPGLLTVLGTDSVRSCRVLAILWTLAETETCDSATRQSRLAVLPAASGRNASHSQDLSNPRCGSIQKQDIHPLKRHKHPGIILICVKEHWAERKCSKKTWFLGMLVFF